RWLRFIIQCRDARQLGAGEDCERRAAARGDVSDLLRDAGLMNRGDRVAAADDDGRAAFGRLGDGARDAYSALVEALLLEDAHRAVPDDRLRVFDFAGEEYDRFLADVEA